MLRILFIQLQPSVASCLFIISASVLCLLLDLCDCMFWLCFVFVLLFVLEVLEERLDELLDLCVGWGQHWAVCRGNVLGRVPCLANTLSRQLASPSTHKRGRIHAQREGSC